MRISSLYCHIANCLHIDARRYEKGAIFFLVIGIPLPARRESPLRARRCDRAKSERSSDICICVAPGNLLWVIGIPRFQGHDNGSLRMSHIRVVYSTRAGNESGLPQVHLPDPNDPLRGSPIGLSGLHSTHFRNGVAARCASSGQGLHSQRSEATRTQNNRSRHE
jgi:hypothetical protein